MEKNKVEYKNLEIENFENVTIEDLKFIFYQAEKKLDDSIKNFDILTTKTFSVISLVTAMFFSEVSYFFVNNDIKGHLDPKQCSVFMISVYTFYILISLVKIILPKLYLVIGSSPEKLLSPKLFIYEYKENSLSTKYLYLNEIENYNFRIATNFEVNTNRQNEFQSYLKKIIYVPIVGIVIYLGMTIFF